MIHYYTSSAAQGGGGSFKNRKPGEVGCCESGMAERSHSWIERWLSVSAYLSIYLSVYLSIYLSVYLSIYLSTYLSIYLPVVVFYVLRATTACTFSSRIWPAGSAPAALASLLFDPPEPQIIGKTQCFATFLPFRASASSFCWLFLFSDLLSSNHSLLSASALLFICPCISASSNHAWTTFQDQFPPATSPCTPWQDCGQKRYTTRVRLRSEKTHNQTEITEWCCKNEIVNLHQNCMLFHMSAEHH